MWRGLGWVKFPFVVQPRGGALWRIPMLKPTTQLAEHQVRNFELETERIFLISGLKRLADHPLKIQGLPRQAAELLFPNV